MTSQLADAAVTSFRIARRELTPRAAASDAPEQHLSEHSVMRVQRPLGQTVECLDGTLWMTQDRDCRDVILFAGCRHRCDRDTALIVQALAGGAKLRFV